MFVLGVFCALIVPIAALPGQWFRSEDHAVNRLFPRQSTFAAVGSAEWRRKFPTGKLNDKDIPQQWLDALDAALADGRIPNIPPSTSPGRYVAANGTSLNAGSRAICSSSVNCKDAMQIYDVPDGIVALSFDDGPLAASPELYKFLRDNNQKATHFFIGANILANPTIFLEAFNDNGDDIAVHTWSHPQMTTLSNTQVLAELGWTVQIIHDSTSGRLPRYWRPAYGDSDTRVRAIAYHIFGLETVIWNDDTNDWKIGQGQTAAAAKSVLTRAYTGPKSPGLNILEHELSKDTVKVFIDTYPLIAQNGWKAESIPNALGESWYLNSADNTSPVTERVVYGGPNGTVPAGSGGSTGGTGSGSGGSGSSSSSASAPNPSTSPSTQSPNSAMSSSPSALVLLLALTIALF